MHSIQNDFLNTLSIDTEVRDLFNKSLSKSFVDCYEWYRKRTGKKYLTKNDVVLISEEASKHFCNILIGEESDE